MSVEASSRWATRNIWQQVALATESHKSWWQEQSALILPEPNLRSANVGSAPPDVDWRDDVVAVHAGRMVVNEAIRRDMEREAAALQKHVKELGPTVRRQVEKRVKMRISRARG